MKQFVDANGAAWSMKLSIAAFERVLETGIDLLDLSATAADLAAEGKTQPIGVRLTTEPALFVKVLWKILEPQALERAVSRDAFLESLDGAALAAAFDAFFDELIIFFQSAGKPAIATTIQKQLAYLVAGNKLAQAKAETVDVERVINHATKRLAEMDINQEIENAFDARATVGPMTFGNRPA